MKILKKKSGNVTFTDHKLLRACLETRLDDETLEMVEEGGSEDQGEVKERERDYRENHQQETKYS